MLLTAYNGVLHGRPICIPLPTEPSGQILRRPRLLVPALIPALVATTGLIRGPFKPLVHAITPGSTGSLQSLIRSARASLLCLCLVLVPFLPLLIRLLVCRPLFAHQRLQPPSPGWLCSSPCCWGLFHTLCLSRHRL